MLVETRGGAAMDKQPETGTHTTQLRFPDFELRNPSAPRDPVKIYLTESELRRGWNLERVLALFGRRR